MTATAVHDLVARRFAWSTDVPAAFFETHADAIARTCLAMACRFERGGRLLAFGAGAQRSDAEHVAVEFVHPVIVGKRALPAMSVSSEADLPSLARADDIVLALCADAPTSALRDALAQARRRGTLTLLLAGPAGDGAGADHAFSVPAPDPMVVQEVHETLYHMLWELVHVFFERRG
jgi:D-sedoheptulose 7-phosphate isomerase